MPQVIPAVVTAVKVFAAKYVLATLIIKTVLINLALGALSRALAGKPKFSGNTGQTVLIRGTTEARRMIYGEVVCSGVLGNAELTGTDNKHLWYINLLAGHQCEAIGDVLLDGVTILSANINATTGAVTQPPYTGKLWIWKRLGTNAQTVLSELDSVSSVWSSTAHLKGIAYIALKLEVDPEVWKNGAPANFRAKVKGRRIYDPRKDSTNGGSGSHRVDDATTWEWTDNEPLCRADFMTGGSIWYDQATPLRIYGPRIPPGEINWAILAASANRADEDVTIPPASPTTTQKRYTCNLVLSCADSHEENRQKFEACSLGATIDAGDGWRILCGGYDAPVITFTDADLVDADDIEWSGGAGLKDSYNAVDGVFFDPSRDWQENTCPTQTNTALVTEEGETITRTIRLEGVTNSYRAQRLCRLHANQAANQESIQLTYWLNGLKLAPWETCNQTLVEQNWTNKVMRSHEVRINLDAAQVTHLFRVDTSASWADPAVGDYEPPATATPVQQSSGPSAPTNLSRTGLSDGIDFRWTASIFLPPGGQYQLLEHTSNVYASATVVWQGFATGTRLTRGDSTVRFYWVRAIDSIGNISTPEPPVDGLPAAAIPPAATVITPPAVFVSAFAISPTDAGAHLRVDNDGHWYTSDNNGSSFVDQGLWCNPTADASLYEMEVTRTGGSETVFTSGTLGTYQALSSDRTYTLVESTDGFASKSILFTIKIRRISDGGGLVQSTGNTMQATVEV